MLQFRYLNLRGGGLVEDLIVTQVAIFVAYGLEVTRPYNVLRIRKIYIFIMRAALSSGTRIFFYKLLGI